jgi:hypothetical protein
MNQADLASAYRMHTLPYSLLNILLIIDSRERRFTAKGLR